MTFNKIFILLAVLCLAPKLLHAQDAEATPSELTVMAKWNAAIHQAAIQSGQSNLVLTRIAAIVHKAMYNAWAYYDDKAISDPCTLFERRPEAERTKENKEMAISYAAYYALAGLLKNQIVIFTELMTSLGYPTATYPTGTKTPDGIGARVGIELIKIRRKDTCNEMGDLNPSGTPYSEPSLLPEYKAYKYINSANQLKDVDYWQPQKNADGTAQTYIYPHWGAVRPFALKSGAQFRPKQCAKRTCDDYDGFIKQAQEVYDMVESITPRQKLIALYWDGQVVGSLSPWHFIAGEIALKHKYSIDEEVKLFFALSNALFDASIACWDAKRVCNSARPISAIRKFLDPTWQTLHEIPTPPSPGFTAEHACLSAAAAVIFKKITGSDNYGGSYTDVATGITLSWDTFSGMMEEAGLSRMYAGVNFEDDILVGQEQGKKVGKIVWEELKDLFDGGEKKSRD